MASTIILFYFMGLPTLGAVAAWASILAARAKVPPQERVESPERPAGPMVLTYLTHPAILLLFGFALWFLLADEEDVLGADLLERGALAFGVAAFLTGLGFALVYGRGAAATLRRPEIFGRVIVLGTLPATGVLFVFAGVFLALGGMVDAATVPEEAVTRAASALPYFAASGFGGLLSGIIARTQWDFESMDTWGRAVALASAGSALALVLFALGYVQLALA